MGVLKIPYRPIKHEEIILESGKIMNIYTKEKTFMNILRRTGYKHIILEKEETG